MLEVAVAVSKRSTCLRRQVGCVLINHRGHILATGYNGVAAGRPHCNESSEQLTVGAICNFPDGNYYPHACKSANANSGQFLDGCEAVHAEQNALLQCRDVWEIDVAYVTVTPCIPCMKMLMNTGCQRIVALSQYAHTEATKLWLDSGRTIEVRL